MKLRISTLICALAFVACSREVRIASQLDQATKMEGTTQADATSHAEQHAQGADKIEDHGQERLDENVVTTHSGGAVELDEVRTLPNGTKVERHYRRAAIEVKRDATKSAAVQRALTADASSLLDAKEDAATKTDTTARTDTATKKKDDTDRQSHPSLGILAALLPYLIGLGAVLLFVATGTNPLTIAMKLLQLAKKLIQKVLP